MNVKKISRNVFVISFCSFFVVSFYEVRTGILREISETYLFLMNIHLSVYDVFYLCLGPIVIVSLTAFMLSLFYTEEKE